MKRIALLNWLWVVGLLLLFIGMSPNSSQAQTQPTSSNPQNNICSLYPAFPEGSNPHVELNESPVHQSGVHSRECRVWISEMYNSGGPLQGVGWATFSFIDQYDSAGDAKAGAEETLREHTNKQPYRIGDVGWEEMPQATDCRAGYCDYTLAFVRGCFVAETRIGLFTSGLSNSANEMPPAQRVETIRNLAQQLDQNLNNAGPCPGAAAPPAESAALPLAVGLACNTDALQSAGTATCVASVTNQQDNANIVYEWQLDGNPQSGVSGNELDLSGINPGQHTVSVLARDSVNNQSAGPQSVNFGFGVAGTSGTPAAGASAPALGSGGGASRVTPSAPIMGPGTPSQASSPQSSRRSGFSVSGPATAVAIAIGILILIRLGLKKARQQQPPASVQTSEPPQPPADLAGQTLIASGVPEQPTGPVEFGSDASPLTPAGAWGVPPTQSLSGTGQGKQRNRKEPHLTLIPIVSLSQRTRLYTPDQKDHIWGDEVDFVFVGYRLRVTPGWTIQISTVQDNFTVDKGTCTRVERFFAFANPIAPTAERKAVVQAPWMDQPGQLTITIDVHAQVISDSGETRTLGDRKSHAISIVGADPRLILSVESELSAEAIGDADGTDVMLVSPNLFLFGQPYAGGLEVSEIIPFVRIPGGAAKGQETMDTYFQARGNDYDQGMDPRIQQQKLALTCRFHLLDKDMKKLAGRGPSVSFRVQPTGMGPGQVNMNDLYPYMQEHFYESCQRNLKKNYPVTPVEVPLRPSKIELEPLRIISLPDASAKPGEEYLLKLRGTVVSASDLPVSGKVIGQEVIGGVLSDSSMAKLGSKWRIKCRFDRPEQELLKQWDPYPNEGTTEFYVADVDEKGRLLFARQDEGNAVTPEELVPECDYDHWQRFFDKKERYLSGQCCRLKIDFLIDEMKSQAPANIFIGPPNKLYVYVDEFGQVYEVGHVSVGLIDTGGQEVRVGFFPDTILGVSHETGQLVGAVGGGVLAGGGAIAAAAWFGIKTFLSPAGVPYVLVTLAAAGLGILAGGAEGNSGTGLLHDDGGASEGEENNKAHEFSICRGWDLSQDEYQRVLENLKEWKKNSDTQQLFYESSGVAFKKWGKFAGNCACLADDALNSVGLPSLFGFALDLRRPGNMGAGMRKLSRVEVKPESTPAYQYKHPWQYGQDAKPGFVSMHKALGKWDPPPKDLSKIEAWNRALNQKPDTSKPNQTAPKDYSRINAWNSALNQSPDTSNQNQDTSPKDYSRIEAWNRALNQSQDTPPKD